MSFVEEVKVALQDLLEESVIRFKLRRSTSDEWASSNPVLADGEQGYETDNHKLKIGNGVSQWNDLVYQNDYDTTQAVFISAVTAIATDIVSGSAGLGSAVEDYLSTFGLHDPRFVETTEDSISVRFDDGSTFFETDETDGVISAVGGSHLERLPDEAGWAFVVIGEDRKVIFGRRSDGTFYPDDIGAQTVELLSVVEIGDSLQANRVTTADGVTATALGRTIINAGVGSQSSDQIAARIGAIPALLTVTGNKIPASGSITVTACTPNLGFHYNDGVDHSWTYDGLLAGIPGTLTVTRTSGTYTYSFTRTVSGNATPCPANSPFQTGFAYRDSIPSIRVGRNNFTSTSTATIVAQIQAILNWSKHSEFAIVESIPPAVGEESGGGPAARGANRDALDALNAALASAFPTQWLDSAAYLRSSDTLASVGITATSQDLTDISNGLTPTSFSLDGILHYNDLAYAALNPLYVARASIANWS